MADIELVIKIPHSLYANLAKIQRGSIASKRILECVCNGTPLPKGHGRLIDADALYDQFEYADYNFDATLEYAPTIIEADKGDEE